MNVAGLIFSNIHDRGIPEMTRKRTMASIPFGCRYRLIDFPLSNMVNADINTVGVVTHYNYQSLLDHIGTGKDWDLARRSGGIKILPPYIAAYENNVAGKLYSNRLEALIGAENFINRCKADYFVLSDCDVLMNIDLKDVIDTHVQSGAHITMVTKRVNAAERANEYDVDAVEIADDGRILSVSRQLPESGECDINTNILVLSRGEILAIISDSLRKGYTSFATDVLAKNVKEKNFRAYRYEGYYSHIGTLESYFASSMKLLTEEARHGLFGIKNRQIYTKIRNSAPTQYGANAVVKNSLIADGCVVEGTVENSIIFRGVKVGKGCVVRNSILLQDTSIGENVQLNCVITDKNAMVKDGRMLSGHESMPFFIGKGMIV
ncbi:MAG: glucose-1-phosphate adenylyltransferase subunit GlgD [Ruminococcaceae bacterium]|nr:glucose-1-phosphate adenylyltransferase subunit GlgD [Oscillospiraceae bacterium]